MLRARTRFSHLGAGLYDLSLAQVPDLLVSDAERQRVADQLRGHYEAGRLTLDEFQQRLDEAHAARTQEQLGHSLRQLPDARLPSVRPRDTRWRSLALQYALVNAVAILVWVFGGASGDFWPKWVLLATLIVFVRRVARQHRPPPRRERRERISRRAGDS